MLPLRFQYDIDDVFASDFLGQGPKPIGIAAMHKANLFGDFGARIVVEIRCESGCACFACSKNVCEQYIRVQERRAVDVAYLLVGVDQEHAQDV